MRWKNALNYDYKNNNSRNFQFTKFLSIDFVLNDKRSLSGKRPKSASGKSSSCRFSFSAARNANTKANEYLTFGFFLNIGFLPLKRSLNLTVCQRYAFLSAIFRESSDKLHVLRIMKALPFIHQPESQKSLYNKAVYVIKSFLNSDEAITFTYFSQVQI